MAVQRVTFFKMNLEDKPGALLSVLKDLKGKNLGLVGLWGYSTSPGNAELNVVAKNADKVRAYWKATGKLVSEMTGFFLKGTDKTGALLKPLEALANAGVNLTGLDGMAVGGKYGSFVWVKAEDVEKAAKSLGAK
jgi:prephenate dehydratase